MGYSDPTLCPRSQYLGCLASMMVQSASDPGLTVCHCAWQGFHSLAGQAKQLQSLLQQAERLRQQQLASGGPGKGLSDHQGTSQHCSLALQTLCVTNEAYARCHSTAVSYGCMSNARVCCEADSGIAHSHQR